MQLDRFLTGHLAPHHSPTRERREARFANPTPPPGSAPDSDKDAEKAGTPKDSETVASVGSAIKSVQHSVLRELSGMDYLESQNLFDAYRSMLTAGYLVIDNQISHRTLEEIARSVGITLEEPAIDPSFTREVINAKKRKSYFDQLIDKTGADKRDELNTRLRPLVMEQLSANPSITLRCAHEMENRAAQYANLQEKIRATLKIDPSIPELEDQFIMIERQNLDANTKEQLKDDLEKKIADAIEDRAKDAAKTTVASSDLDTLFERYFDEIFRQRRADAIRSQSYTGNFEELKLTKDEKLNIRIDARRGMMGNVRKQIRKARNFGGSQTSKESQDVEKPDAVMERLQGESFALRLVLDAQLQERAKEVLKMHKARLEKLLLAVDPALTIEKAEVILLTRTRSGNPAWTPSRARQEEHAAQDLESRFLGKHGFSIIPLLDDYGQVQTQALRQCREAAHTDEQGKPFYTLPPAPDRKKDDEQDFLISAKEDIAVWNRRENDLNREAGDGTMLEAEPDIIALRDEQIATETWAHEMAKKIREIENLPAPQKSWTERLEMIRSLLPIPEGEKNAFIADFKDYFARLRNYAGGESPQQLRAQLNKCVTPTRFPIHTQTRISQCLEYLRDPSRLERAVAHVKTIDAQIDAETKDLDTDSAIINIREQTRGRLRTAIGILIPERANTDTTGDPKRTERNGLYPPLRHSISEYLNLGYFFLGRQREIEQRMDAAVQDKNKSGIGKLRSLYAERTEVEKIEQCVRMLNDVRNNIQEVNDLPENVPAEYRPNHQPRPIIAIRPGVDRNGPEVEHERAHAILDILRTRTGLFPRLIQGTLDEFSTRSTPSGQTFDQALSLLDWGSYKAIREEHLEPNIEREELMEELLIRFADYKAGRIARPFSDAEQSLFDLMERKPRAPMKSGPIEKDFRRRLNRVGRVQDQPIRRATRRRMTVDADAAPKQKEIFNMREMLNDTDRALRNVKQFIYAYTEPPDFPPDLFVELKDKYQDGEDEFNELEKIFREKSQWRDPQTPPEDDHEQQERCKKLIAYAEKLETVVVNYDNQRLDTTKQARDVGIWEALTGGVRLASINDVVRLWNDTWEDIKDIYKRRQDAVLKDIGYAITKPLQDSSLLKQIPGAGKYLTGLHAYHQRRYSGTEEEAANKWKDGMKNEDSHTLQHFLHSTKNKDAVRGIIALLCSRGEMDWNDTGTWTTLNAISGYNMPERPCLRSDVLRDTWLRKIISYIWNDKELYYHWRSENDSQTKSGKEHFTPWVDQLSNLRGGMEGELNKQLRLWNEWKTYEEKHHTGTTPPEDIKPHLFEKIIHYAIENGKMTMEQKFYYLIRGVADGLLSIDRLRTLAGEEGGVLNQFPFIDYFYKKNNTLPEVQALRNRLRETKDGVDTFRPGAKTTLWIQLDLVRNKGVQERLSKGTSRTSSETIDHEDVPLFLPQLDFNAVRGMADVISGSRQKMSPEGLKNLYCGYSSKFKIFGRLAQLEENGEERFTPEDASILADALGAYVDVDNILARRGYNTETRPTLSLSQLASHSPSSDGVHTIAKYRENMNKFVIKLVTRLKDKIEQSSHWQTYLSQNKMKDGGKKTREGPNGEPQDYYEKEQPIRLLGDYIATDKDVVAGKKIDKKDATVGRKLFDGTPAFVQALKEVLPQNLHVLKEVLMDFTKDYKLSSGADNPDYANGFFDEGGSSGQVSLENVKAAVEARDVARRELMVVPSGGHH